MGQCRGHWVQTFPRATGCYFGEEWNVWHRVTLIMWPIIWCPGHTQGSPIIPLHAVRHTSWHCPECCCCQYIIIMTQLQEWGGDNNKTFFPLLMEMLSTYWIILTQQRMTVCLQLIAIHSSRWFLLTHSRVCSWEWEPFLYWSVSPSLCCLLSLDLLWVHSSKFQLWLVSDQQCSI